MPLKASRTPVTLCASTKTGAASVCHGLAVVTDILPHPASQQLAKVTMDWTFEIMSQNESLLSWVDFSSCLSYDERQINTDNNGNFFKKKKGRALCASGCVDQSSEFLLELRKAEEEEWWQRNKKRNGCDKKSSQAQRAVDWGLQPWPWSGDFAEVTHLDQPWSLHLKKL